jgi:hypothetical protein
MARLLILPPLGQNKRHPVCSRTPQSSQARTLGLAACDPQISTDLCARFPLMRRKRSPPSWIVNMIQPRCPAGDVRRIHFVFTISEAVDTNSTRSSKPHGRGNHDWHKAGPS